jgi:hypothetical protein
VRLLHFARPCGGSRFGDAREGHSVAVPAVRRGFPTGVPPGRRCAAGTTVWPPSVRALRWAGPGSRGGGSVALCPSRGGGPRGPRRPPIAGNGRTAADWRSPSRSRVNRARLAGLVRLSYERNRAAHAELLETLPAHGRPLRGAQRAKALEAHDCGCTKAAQRGVTAARRLCCQ